MLLQIQSPEVDLNSQPDILDAWLRRDEAPLSRI